MHVVQAGREYRGNLEIVAEVYKTCVGFELQAHSQKVIAIDIYYITTERHYILLLLLLFLHPLLSYRHILKSHCFSTILLWY